MNITYLPVLAVLRDLYLQPRDMQRFRTYVATLTGGTDDVVLPIGVANPMAKEHAVRRIDELLAMGADAIAAEAASRAATRLAYIPLEVEIKASLVLVDDVGGGWTNRFYRVAYQQRHGLPKPWPRCSNRRGWPACLPAHALACAERS